MLIGSRSALPSPIKTTGVSAGQGRIKSTRRSVSRGEEAVGYEGRIDVVLLVHELVVEGI